MSILRRKQPRQDSPSLSYISLVTKYPSSDFGFYPCLIFMWTAVAIIHFPGTTSYYFRRKYQQQHKSWWSYRSQHIIFTFPQTLDISISSHIEVSARSSLPFFWLTLFSFLSFYLFLITVYLGRLTNWPRSRSRSSRRRSPSSTRMATAPSPPRSSERWDILDIFGIFWICLGYFGNSWDIFGVTVKGFVIWFGLWQPGSFPC